MKRIIAFIFTSLSALAPLNARVVPAEGIFGDHMVLQQNAEAAIWGKAEGKTVTIKASWLKKDIKVATESDGSWHSSIKTCAAGGPFSISFSDGVGEKTVISDILTGEVWFCSGQSNMVMPMKGFTGQPVEGAIEYILKASPDIPIRIFNVGRQALPEPASKIKGKWKTCSPESVSECSAVAYMYASFLQDVLKVPVGIVVSAWGGSKICAWMYDVPGKGTIAAKGSEHKTPSYLYNGMVAPLVPFTFAGEIWYQGESDRSKHDIYGAHLKYLEKFPAYVAQMRSKFNNPEMPFYYVQIAPYNYEGAESVSSPLLQETQERCLDIIPNSGMATTLDLGDPNVIHPARKRQVAQRLALLALEKTYGIKGLYAQVPRLVKAEVSGGRMLLSFSNAKEGLNPIGVNLRGFEIAGPDKIFRPAVARVSSKRDMVEVWSEEVSEPAFVRYCFHNYAEAGLFNCVGIPVGPFRTDGDKSAPMFWTWMEDREGLNLDSLFTSMNEAGIDGLMLYLPDLEGYRKAAALAKKHGVTLYAWIWTLRPRGDRDYLVEHHPDWFDVNVEGKSLLEYKAYLDSYKFLSAAVPDVKDYVRDNIRKVCEIDGIEGICLDYCRIVDGVLPISLAYKYDIVQDGEVWPEYNLGFHPAAVSRFISEYGYDPRKVKDPSRDEKWTAFRNGLITEIANSAAEVAHSYGKKVAASPFSSTGIASFMVGQNFAEWNLDLVFPMEYSFFYSMEPGFVYDATVQNAETVPSGTTLCCGIDAELGGSLNDLMESMDAAFRGGAQGISLYTVAGLDTPSKRAVFKAYADSLRIIRDGNGGRMPQLQAPSYATTPSDRLNPLAHTRIMNLVKRSIRRLIAGESLHSSSSVNGFVSESGSEIYPETDLGDFVLTQSNDRILKYEVTDKVSRRRFCVIFPIYGGLISGWDVREITGAAKPRYKNILLRDFRTVHQGKVISYNIGTAAHCPATISALRKELPDDVKITVWADAPLCPELEEMMRMLRMDIPIVYGSLQDNPSEELLKAVEESDLLLVSSGSGIPESVKKSIKQYTARTGKPVAAYAIGFGASLGEYTEDMAFCLTRDEEALRKARKKDALPAVNGLAPDAVFDFDVQDDMAADKLLKDKGLNEGDFLCCIPGYRYTPSWEFYGVGYDARKDSVNRAMCGADNAVLRKCIEQVVRRYGKKVLICAEQIPELRLCREEIFDKLPPDIRKECVLLDTLWSPQLALGVYRKSCCVFGIEMHSQIMAAGNGIPAVIIYHSGFGTKSDMWNTFGLGKWMVNLDARGKGSAESYRIAEDTAVSAICGILDNPESARLILKSCRLKIDESRKQAISKCFF